MAPRSKIKKRSSGSSPTSTQLAFNFADTSPIALTVVEAVPHTAIEILPPATPLSVPPMPNEAGASLDAAEENKYLLHQADKYEDRAIKALVLFIGSACLTILAKSGVPMPTSMSEKLGIPPVGNIRLLCGMLAAATTIFSVTLAYFALRIRQHSPQLKLKLIERTWTGYVAQYMLWLCGLLVGAMLLAVLLVAGRDVIYLLTYIVDRQLYILDGWDPIRR